MRRKNLSRNSLRNSANAPKTSEIFVTRRRKPFRSTRKRHERKRIKSREKFKDLMQKKLTIGLQWIKKSKT